MAPTEAINVGARFKESSTMTLSIVPDQDQYAVPPLPRTTVPVASGGKPFPVHRIYCVGRNYADHAVEMGSDPEREPPFFFSKPADAVVPLGGDVAYPPLTGNLHYEGELVVAIGKSAADIGVDEALDLVFGYAVGLDLTRRDLQTAAKKVGQPWDMAKGFDHSAPCSTIHKAEAIDHPGAGRIQLRVNGEIRQDADIASMIWSVPELIAKLSQYVQLRAGDLIFTGTPAGVGALVKGDVVEVGISGIDTLRVKIV
jgi:fumarylpyruvate hydrolase